MRSDARPRSPPRHLPARGRIERDAGFGQHALEEVAFAEHRRVAQQAHELGGAVVGLGGRGAVPLDHLPILAPPQRLRSEEHTSELQSLMRTSYAAFCLHKKKYNLTSTTDTH